MRSPGREIFLVSAYRYANTVEPVVSGHCIRGTPVIWTVFFQVRSVSTKNRFECITIRAFANNGLHTLVAFIELLVMAHEFPVTE